MNSSINIIILAAGTSSRMGKTKQMLLLGEKVILEHVIDLTLAESFSEIITVIGHDASVLQDNILIEDERFQWVINEDYHLGQSYSLKKGLESIEKDCTNIMVILGDLPFISSDTIHSIFLMGRKKMSETKTPFVIQPSFNGLSGHPVFFGNFDKEFFKQQLHSDRGAKTLINQIHDRHILKVDDWGITFDIDTPATYEKARKHYSFIR